MRFRLPWKPLAVGAALGFAAAGACKMGGEGVEAPEPPPDPVQDQYCRSPGDLMPEFFKLLRAGELASLKTAVARLTEEEKIPNTNVKELSPFNRLLDATFAGMKLLAANPDDPFEGESPRCLTAAPDLPAGAPADLRCSDPANPRNCLCEVGRSLGRLLRDRDANGVKVGEKFIESATPIILKILKYVNGHGQCPETEPNCPFERTHYNGLVVVGGIIARSEGPCDPTHATEMLDAMMGFMGADSGPEKSLRLLGAVEAMLGDPVMQEFLDTFTTAASGAGKGAFKILNDALLDAVINNPDAGDPDKYFDNIARFDAQGNVTGGALKMLFDFLGNNQKWGGLLSQVKSLLQEVVKPMLHPAVGISGPLGKVLECSQGSDSEGHLVSALYDLLKARDEEGGIDLVPLVRSLKELAAVDTDGTIMRAMRELLRLQSRSEESVLALRDVLRRALEGECDANGQSCTGTVTQIVPALEVLVEHGVIVEFLLLMDQLVYGCEKRPATP